MQVSSPLAGELFTFSPPSTSQTRFNPLFGGELINPFTHAHLAILHK